MHPGRIVDQHSVAALAFPHLRPRQRQFVLANRHGCTIADARNFLAGERNAFSSWFNTEPRKEELRSAVAHVDACVRAWIEGRRRDPRYQWVLPARLVPALSRGSYTPTLVSRLGRTGGGRLLSSCAHLHIWLPHLSLEAVYALRRFRESDYPKLQIALAQLAGANGARAGARPWLTGFPMRSAALPTSWLYHFRAEQRTGVLISWLASGGLVNVGHLAAMHPEALQRVTAITPAQWQEVYLSLRSS